MFFLGHSLLNNVLNIVGESLPRVALASQLCTDA